MDRVTIFGRFGAAFLCCEISDQKFWGVSDAVGGGGWGWGRIGGTGGAVAGCTAKWGWGWKELGEYMSDYIGLFLISLLSSTYN